MEFTLPGASEETQNQSGIPWRLDHRIAPIRQNHKIDQKIDRMPDRRSDQFSRIPRPSIHVRVFDDRGHSSKNGLDRRERVIGMQNLHGNFEKPCQFKNQHDLLKKQSNQLGNLSDQLENQCYQLGNQPDHLEIQTDHLENQSDQLGNLSYQLKNMSDHHENQSDHLGNQCHQLGNLPDQRHHAVNSIRLPKLRSVLIDDSGLIPSTSKMDQSDFSWEKEEKNQEDEEKKEDLEEQEEQQEKEAQEKSGEAEPEEPKKVLTKQQKAILEFVQNVSIAGLSDTYRAVFLPEKIMWYIAYILALIGIIRSCNQIADQYTNQTPGYDDLEIMADQAPFPNVSICAPEAIDRRRASTKIEVPDKIKDYIRNHGLSEREIIDRAIEYSTVNSIKPKVLNGSLAYALAKTMAATFDGIDGGYPQFIRALYPDCEKSLIDCKLDGKRFDCCKASRFIPFDNSVCYHMQIPNTSDTNTASITTPQTPSMAPQNQNPPQNPSQNPNPPAQASILIPPGLEFTVKIDRNSTTFTEDVASDGFHIHIGPMVSVMSTPIAIPSGMDAIIVLAPPRRMLERTQCRQMDDLGHLRFFDHYDQYGVNCFSNSIIEIFASVLGCAIPYLTLDSHNMTPCGIEAMFLFSMFLEIDNVSMSGNNAQSKLYASTTNARKICQPLCTRWTYPVISASYAKIQYAYTQSRDRSQTWSRIKIYFPSESYQLHQEKPLIQAYVVVCNIGTILSSYAGISMITFTEVLAYGVMIVLVLPVVIKVKKQVIEKIRKIDA